MRPFLAIPLLIADPEILRAMLAIGALFLFAIGLTIVGIGWLGSKRDGF